MPSEQAQLDELSTILHYPFGCAALKAAPDECRRRAGWQECAAASDALDACVEAGERRKFRAEKDCGTLKRRWHACFLNREPNCEEPLSAYVGCMRAVEVPPPPPAPPPPGVGPAAASAAAARWTHTVECVWRASGAPLIGLKRDRGGRRASERRQKASAACCRSHASRADQ